MHGQHIGKNRLRTNSEATNSATEAKFLGEMG